MSYKNEYEETATSKDLDLENYTQEVVHGLMRKFSEHLLRYTGTDAKSMEEMIIDKLIRSGKHYEVITGYNLIKTSVEDHWESNHTVSQAVEDLYKPVNTYINAQASVM